MTDEHIPFSPARRTLYGARRAFGAVAIAAGLLASAIMLLLALSILCGIGLRAVGIDNAWTYDLDTFCLIWLAFLGAAYTGYRGAHVTSGISLEHMLGGAMLLRLVRFVIVASFLVVFIHSGFEQWHSSWLFNEKTLDVVQWPVWIAKLSLPVGGVAWLAGEIHNILAPRDTPPADH